jgi:hypothetical protein
MIHVVRLRGYARLRLFPVYSQMIPRRSRGIGKGNGVMWIVFVGWIALQNDLVVGIAGWEV